MCSAAADPRLPGALHAPRCGNPLQPITKKEQLIDTYRFTHDPVAVGDYVVVGTGSAGSVLAERLSADPRNQVVVLEAGGTDNDRRIHMPVTWMQLFRSAIDWDYLTEPQLGLNGRPIYWPQGKTLGGSSSMNAMMWVRGFAADYDDWARHAREQWFFNRIVKYFRQIETVEGARQHDEGVGGPLHISHQRSPHRFTAAWLDAVRQTGYLVERANLPRPEGFTQTMVSHLFEGIESFELLLRRRAHIGGVDDHAQIGIAWWNQCFVVERHRSHRFVVNALGPMSMLENPVIRPEPGELVRLPREVTDQSGLPAAVAIGAGGQPQDRHQLLGDL